ncbi:GTP-binding protein [Metapseudomonas lalkuanensis]|uniref:GTP-binding protein n=1 Tax=Metapseudomonas lalkuanensis TaxID=2604832 RepID=A0A5J6QQS8_9GAMM|nr:GTP-binding protein [Pseudomonas lalkuanensis]QEY63036.1 GTP-binding protein [Pseudomonas lalkuanensis]
MRAEKIPVTVISGFLGAGKTTLVNHLLGQNEAFRIGVVVNEFGEVGIDGQLIVSEQEALIEINNGCVCCTVRADLVASVKEMLDLAGHRLDRLVVETSGLADPAPVLQTFLADPDLRSQVDLESVITVIDALHLQQQLSDEIVREQIAFADTLIVNKIDLVSEEVLRAIQNEVRMVNRTATVVRSVNSEAPIDALLGTKRFSLPNLLMIEPDILEEEDHDHEHDTSISSCSVVTSGALDADRFHRWVNQLVNDQGQRLMRMKGLLNFASEARRFHFHSVHMLLEAMPGPRWEADEPRDNRFVFIGRDLDREQLRQGFLDCLHAA